MNRLLAIRLAPVLAVSALALAACGKSDASFDAKVHDYLQRHPEVVQEALVKLQAQQDAAQAEKAKGAIVQYRQAIERDPRDFVANPNGRITLTEFYDYRCPHCINAAAAVTNIIKTQPDVRVVFKEFPIFGATSERAAAGAIALKNQGGDVLALYQEFMNTRPLDDAAIDRILRAHGVDPSKLDSGPVHEQAVAEMAAVRQLAENLSIEGTPAFIVGDTLVPGDDTDAVTAAINKARKSAG